MKCLLICAAVFININIVSSSFCYWNSGCPYKCFSSATPYNSIRGDIRDSTIRFKGCEPVSIWGIIRHGKSNPGSEEAALMRQALVIRDYIEESRAAGKCSYCAQDVENLRNWPIDLKMFEEVNSLTYEGYNEVLQLGQRLKQAFPKLLDSLEDGIQVVEPISGYLTEGSAKAFTKGFNDKKMTYVKPNGQSYNMEPYVMCKKYHTDKKQNLKVNEETKLYLSNPEYLVAKDRIQRRSGINYSFTDDNITALYNLCRYNSSGVDNNISPWCALFTIEDLKVLDYIGDLRHYYQNGYGNTMAEKFGRLPMTDLLKSFKQTKEGKGKKLTAYITQDTMMDMVYTTLGLFKDDKPLSGAQRNSGRKWRSCKLSTFTSNFFAVLNRCTTNELDDYNVVFYLNEEPLMSICKAGVCTWEEFEEKLTFDNVSLDFCES